MSIFLNLINLLLPRHNLYCSNTNKYFTDKEINSLPYQGILPLSKKDINYIDQIWSATKYNLPLIKDAIYRSKFMGEYDFCSDFVDIIFNKLNQSNLLKKLPDIITFVPKDPIRGQKRGFHLPKIIANKLGQKLKLQTYNILLKTTTTEPQTILKKRIRLLNLKNKIIFNYNQIDLVKLNFQKIWLIDDVTTTFSTLKECSKILKENFKCEVIGITIAH